MLDRLVHRGPDGEGLWGGPGIALGHRRLAIVDISEAGRQPMHTQDGSLVAVVNGEIYNYPGLRRELEQCGARFHSHCDSEVVLHAYRAWGVDGFQRLSGMFAFGLFDRDLNRLFVVRDRLGIKPVYYWHDAQNGHLLFASEIKALLAATTQRWWQIDQTGLRQYLTYQNMMGGQTLFAGIQLLRPGHYLEFDSGRCRIVHFAKERPVDQASRESFPAAVRQFCATLGAAVERHLMSDVPVASYLSSGFDSTMVASYASRAMQQPLATFTGHFDEGTWYDESIGAQLVADRISAPLTRVAIRASDFEAHFDDVIRALDEPRMGIGAFSQYLVAKSAARQCKVILTGHGGDELFSGYPVFKFALLQHHANSRSPAVIKAACSVRPSEVPYLAYFALRQLQPKGTLQFLPVLFPPSEQELILQRGSGLPEDGGDAEAELAGTHQTPYEQLLFTYLKIYLPGLLVVEDKISMAHSLEARTPLLDDGMVAFALSLPQEIKLHDGALKAVIKSAARNVLPSELFAMPKRGFPTPLSHWLRGPLSAWMRERIAGKGTVLTRLFRREFLENTSGRYLRSWRKHVRQLDEIETHRIWMLLSLESWIRQHEEHYGVSLQLN